MAAAGRKVRDVLVSVAPEGSRMAGDADATKFVANLHAIGWALSPPHTTLVARSLGTPLARAPRSRLRPSHTSPHQLRRTSGPGNGSLSQTLAFCRPEIDPCQSEIPIPSKLLDFPDGQFRKFPLRKKRLQSDLDKLRTRGRYFRRIVDSQFTERESL